MIWAVSTMSMIMMVDSFSDHAAAANTQYWPHFYVILHFYEVLWSNIVSHVSVYKFELSLAGRYHNWNYVVKDASKLIAAEIEINLSLLKFYSQQSQWSHCLEIVANLDAVFTFKINRCWNWNKFKFIKILLTTVTVITLSGNCCQFRCCFHICNTGSNGLYWWDYDVHVGLQNLLTFAHPV